MHVTTRRAHERGATAMIIVIFSTLLFVVVSVGFMSIMTQEQRNSFDNELSQGAYDAALAGVEDAKRVFQACTNGDQAVCNVIETQGDRCNVVSASGITTAGANGETYVKSVSASGTGGQDFQEAYTCVKINRDTDNYMGTLAKDESVVIPLRGVSGFNRVLIQWYKKDDVVKSTVDLSADVANVTLPTASSWPANRPPLVRAQLIQSKTKDIDSVEYDNNGNGHTVYLLPKRTASGVGARINSYQFASDGRRSGAIAPMPALCNIDFSANDGHSCAVSLDLPNPVGGDMNNRAAYMRLSSMYGATHYTVTLYNGESKIRFRDIQPAIDSTGRAGDVYRRVEARVENTDPNDKMLYPRATVDMTNNFCKDFSITDKPEHYRDVCSSF